MPEVLKNEITHRQAPSTGASNVRIRPYAAKDRPAIRHLCCETGFLGRPVDGLFHDRELFADLFTNAYLDYAPQWALVAEAAPSAPGLNGDTAGLDLGQKGERVIGYLIGAVSPRFDLLLMRSGFVTTTKMLLRLASGRYAGQPRSRRFIRWLLTAGYREQPRHPPRAAHLHCDLERGFRGRGIGRRLWETYDHMLRQAGFQECYGAFFSYNRRRPETAYRRYGFTVYDRRRTTLFEPDIPDPVEIVCVHKRL